MGTPVNLGSPSKNATISKLFPCLVAFCQTAEASSASTGGDSAPRASPHTHKGTKTTQQMSLLQHRKASQLIPGRHRFRCRFDRRRSIVWAEKRIISPVSKGGNEESESPDVTVVFGNITSLCLNRGDINLFRIDCHSQVRSLKTRRSVMLTTCSSEFWPTASPAGVSSGRRNLLG